MSEALRALASRFWGKISRQSLNSGLFCNWTTGLPHQVTTSVCFSPGENENFMALLHSAPTRSITADWAALGIISAPSLATEVLLLHYREMKTGGNTSRSICLLPLPSTCAICMQTNHHKTEQQFKWLTFKC